MNEKNFNSISQFEVPQIWLDNALDVPQNHVKKPIPLIKLSRLLVAAMCFVLVCGISVALYFMTDDSSIPPVKSPTQAYTDSSESVSQEKPADGTEKSQDDEKDKNKDKDKKEEPTQNSHPERSEDETENTQSTEKPQSKPEEKPTQKPQKPTTDQKPDETQPSENIEPSESVPKPPYDPTMPPFVDTPTECPTMPPEVPELPTESPEAPSEPPTIDYYNIKVRTDIMLNRLTGSQNVYCKIYSPDGTLMGDPNLYSSSHLAQKEFQTNAYVRVCYYPYRSLNIMTSGNYKVIFYNENGEQLYIETRYFMAE